MKILLVEDSATLRFAMESYISEVGHETIIAENGETAVQIVDQMTIDMVIMDVEMPGLDGFDTTRLIRESLGDHWIPIIFVTGKNDDDSLHKGIAVGGDDYLIKPVSKVILQAKIGAMERIANMRSQMHKLNEELTRLSQRDGLTELFNRRTFEEKASEAWRMAARNKTPLSIMLFDIDYFKLFNDTYGHVAGDECIRKVASCISSCLHRPGDIVARYGGEEFIALLPDTDEKGAEHTAESIRSAIEKLNIAHSKSPDFQKVTVSVGATTLKYTTGTNLEQQIEVADEELYKSKKAGRNQIHTTSYSNFHSVLLIGKSGANQANVRNILRDHCELYTVTEMDHLDQLPSEFKPKLVLLAAQSRDDESIHLFEQLDERYDLMTTALILVSPLDKSELKSIGKLVGANASLASPVDSNKLISKLALYLDK